MKNLFLQIIRTQHEIQDLHHQVDQVKLRLTTDIKVKTKIYSFSLLVFNYSSYEIKLKMNVEH